MSHASNKKRSLKLWEALALSLGMVGPTLAMSGNAQGLIDSVGKALPIVFVLGLIGVALIAYGFIRLTRFYNHAGSAYGLVGKTVGPRAGFFSGFAIMGTYLFFSIGTLAALGAFTNAFLAALFPSSGFQIPWIITATVGVIFSWILNSRDGKTVARVLMVIEGLGIVLMLVLAAVIVVHQPATGAEHASLFSLNGVSFQAVMAGVVAAFLSWAGFEACATLGEETENPKRNIPLALLGSILLTGVLFVGMMYVQTLGFGLSESGLNAFKNSANSLGTLSQTYVGTAFTLAMLFTAMMSAFAANLSAAATSSRLLFALARDGFGPACFAKMSDKNHQPRNALTLILILSLLVDVVAWLSGKPAMGTGNSARDAYFYFAIIGSVCLMVAYLMIEIGVINFIARMGQNIPKWELIMPALGIVIMVMSLYFNVAGQEELFSPALVAFYWCIAGLITIISAPKLVRNIGLSLASEFATPGDKVATRTVQKEWI
ncbi:APC family permease [Klebsiella pneumoniae]|uniref:APC family permease n=1 Tax=Klebsiella pneumoniae TaxID=573 RepID=UPI000CEC4213|nr:APC family permease [Klebsiella pneumoniae]ROE48742.1 APC family permease [Klebsiella pneumoniae subsp. pneumoniae]